MTDTYTDKEEIVHPADPPQQLVDFVGAFQDPQAQEAFGDAAIRVQDYMMRRDIAADNAAAANRLVSNLGRFKDGLTSMVSADPAAVDLGLDLVPDIVHGIAQTHPYLPDDQRDTVYDSITTDIQREIARAGVMSLAGRSATAARALLDSDRVSSLLGDDRSGIEGYIGAMDMARGMDAEATARQRAEDSARQVNHSTVQYLGALVDPATGDTQFPNGWAQRVMADPTLPPVQTAAMLDVYHRVRDGDGETDWYAFADMTSRIANGQPVPLPEVFNQIGRGLKVADAATIARGSIDSAAPPAQREFRHLDATIQAAREVLAPPEYGVAGERAFERFMGWLVPQYRAAGPGSLNPAGDRYLLPTGDGAATFWNNFAPRLGDYVTGRGLAGENRPPLSDIFGRRGGPRSTSVRG